MSGKDLTILFATRNGEQVIGRTLEGYCAVEAPPQTWKLVIVDNGSTDSTRSIIESFRNRLPIDQLKEPVPGKNRALNTGLSAIEGSVLILTDDDAVPDPCFLRAWNAAFARHSDFALFGGSIKPLFDAPPPGWLVENEFYYDMLFSARNLPEGPVEATAIYGPNMAVRTSVFDRGFRFNENIGPNASNADYPMGSETEFCRKLAQSGVASWNAREPLVYHIIRTHQVDDSYMVQRAYRHGRGLARQKWEVGQTVASDLPRPYLVRLLSRLRNRARMLSPSPAQRFKGLFGYHSSRGFNDECAKIRLDSAR